MVLHYLCETIWNGTSNTYVKLFEQNVNKQQKVMCSKMNIKLSIFLLEQCSTKCNLAGINKWNHSGSMLIFIWINLAFFFIACWWQWIWSGFVTLAVKTVGSQVGVSCLLSTCGTAGCVFETKLQRR